MKLKFSNREILKIIGISIAVFVIFGGVTAVYENPFFQRMTPVYWLDYVFLILESILMGLFFGLKAPVCASRKAGIGGVLGFLAFACPICNKLLLFLFGSGLLLTYLEPIRPFLGVLGVLLMSIAVYKKLSLKSLTYSYD